MASKYQIYADMAEQQAESITSSRESWTAFLETASRLYKYSFPEQLLIHAQKPDVTACATFETWKTPMNRSVKRGSKGIAVIDDTDGKRKLKYLFDISDTVGGYNNSRSPFIWEIKQEHLSPVIKALESKYGENAGNFSDGNLGDILYNITFDLAQEYNIDNDLRDSIKDSKLNNHNDVYIIESFRNATAVSIAYSLISRCGLNPHDYIGDNDFKCLSDFNTSKSVSKLGVTVSENTERVLRDIESVIKKLERQKAAERSVENARDERTDIHNGGGLSDSGHRTEGTGSRADGQIRHDAEELSQRTPTGDVYTYAVDGGTIPTPVGNRPNSEQAVGADDERIYGERPTTGQSNESNGLGSSYEQSESTSGRIYTERASIQLNNDTDDMQKETSFEREMSVRNDVSLSDVLINAQITEEIFDAILREGINSINADMFKAADSTLRIAAHYMKDKTTAENVDFLINEYGTCGKGVQIGERKISVWFDKDGILIADGSTALRSDKKTLITWEQAEKRISELLKEGTYIPRNELDKAEAYERKQVARNLWQLSYDSIVKLPVFKDSRIYVNGAPEGIKIIADMLSNPDILDKAIDNLRDFSNSYKKNRFLINKNREIHTPDEPEKIIQSLLELKKPVITLPAGDVPDLDYLPFISDDEIEQYLINQEGYKGHQKYNTLSFFLHEHSIQDKVMHLINRYGEEDDLQIRRPFGSKKSCWLSLPLEDAVKKIDELINTGRYMTRSELERIPLYEKYELTTDVLNFVSTLVPYELRESPELKALKSGGRDLIKEVLDDPKRTADMIEKMAPMLENPDIRFNLKRNSLYNNIVSYRDGKYNLFPNISRIPIPEEIDDRLVKGREKAKQSLNEINNPPENISISDETTNYKMTDEQITGYNKPVVSFSISQTEIDSLLLSIKDTDKARIASQFKDNPRSLEAVRLVRGIYGNIINTIPYLDKESGHLGIFGDSTGVSLRWCVGVDTPMSMLPPFQPLALSWTDLHKRIIELAEEGRFSVGDYQHSAVKDITEQTEATTADIRPPEEEIKQSSETLFPESAGANFRITDEKLGEGGAKTKYGYNIAAIRVLKQTESENRLANPDEQEILSRFVGWGGIPQAFDSENESWTKEYAELKELLTPDEYDSARASTLNAHYTSPMVVKSIYEAVERMGFKGGNILEPACGVGNFFGMLPQSMQNSSLYGVEMDSISGRIAKQLYQKANITVSGFEKTSMPENFFDLAIGNVPFGSYKVMDKKYDKHNFLIHDYFFAKTLDQVRPGGIVAFITSKGTMDKQSSEVRKYIAQRAELLGAVRLPNNAFLKNAGTQVTSDILFFQKRAGIIDIVPDWVHLGMTENGIPVNSYFAENPDMIMGKMAFDDMMYGNKRETTCIQNPGSDLGAQLWSALRRMHGRYDALQITEDEISSDTSLPADPNVRNYSFTVVDGTVYFRENSRMNPVDVPNTASERIKGMIDLRDCVHKLINYQLEDYSDTDITAQQTELNHLYDEFTAKYGLITNNANSRAFSSDSAYYLLCSLEILDENNELRRKADIFSKRTVKQRNTVTHVDTSSEALAVSIGEKACVDLAYMSKLTGKDEETIKDELKGVIFLNVGGAENQSQTYVTADEYLSGNVRQKLEAAIAANEALGDDSLAVNINALRAAQPKDLDASEISVRLGSTWINKEYIDQFITETLNPPYYLADSIKTHYSEYTGEWKVEASHRYIRENDVLANETYGTSRMNAYRIIEETLNLKDVRIYDTSTVDGREVRRLNKNETTLAQQKQESIKQEFKEWIFKDPERRRDLVKTYNERFNSFRPREYDGSHINFSGISPEIALRPHQLNAIAHILYGGNTLLAHEVGAGKTFEMIAAAMESKRLGLCQKSLFAVPNHLTEQTASEFLRLYPAANILVATAKDFETKNRKKFCARIAAGDYDAIIIGHSQMEKIPLSKERQERLLKEQICEVTDGIAGLKYSDGEGFTIKQLEKTKKSLEVRLEKLTDGNRKDDVVTFEQLGVDRIFVDEAHSYKNLFLYTKMRNVAGIGQSEAQKSSDLFMKCRYLDEITDSKGIIFATGTPISNSMTELYTMQRYLQYNTLTGNGLAHFDSWASTFGETSTAIELAPEGTGYRARTRFAKFHNLPELMSVFKEVADIKTADTLDLPRPKAIYNTAVVNPSELQKEMVKDLSLRAAEVHRGSIDPSVDNMLKITNDGRKIGLDQRLINPLLPDEPGSKVNTCMNNVFDIWRDTKADRLTQLVFCDISTPNTDGRFNVYDDIKNKLIAKGIPPDEIAFIHDADTESRKKELFAKVRQGSVRVLFGSTIKMGSGTNVQDRLIHLHDLDCPWRPSDLEQRAGRIVRQGNINPEVGITRYVTEGTFDAYLYQTIEKKQHFISQIMTSKSPVRSCEDADEAALSYAEIKALCAGDPLIKEKMDLDIDVARLRLLKANRMSQIYRLEDELLTTFPKSMERENEMIAGLSKDIERVTAGTHPNEDGFSPMEIRGVVYSEKDKAGAALLEACKDTAGTDPERIGRCRGLDMYLSFDTREKAFHVTLKGSLSYGFDLGKDIFGNITRLNNVINDLPGKLSESQLKLENLHRQIKNAETEIKKPFAFEAELKEKESRLAYLDSALNMEEKSGGDAESSITGEPVVQGNSDAKEKTKYEKSSDIRAKENDKGSNISILKKIEAGKNRISEGKEINNPEKSKKTERD